MIRSYIVVALRNLKRHPLFSFINIFGLSLSLAFCLLVVVITNDQLSFDTFHKNPEEVYRVLTNAHRKNGGTESYASTPQPIGDILRSGSTHVASSASLVRFFGEVQTSGEAIQAAGFFAEESFFDIFAFALKEGSVSTALKQPNAIIITSRFSEKLFGDGPALGRSVSFGEVGTYIVTGVLQPFAGKTHLEFDLLMPSPALLALARQGRYDGVVNDWNNYYRTYTFIRLKPGSTPEDLAPMIAAIPGTYYAGLPLESRDAGYTFELQPLLSITPGRILSQSMGRGVPEVLITFMSILALVGMAAAIFNYTMLTIARALSRAKEIGIRKVSGAARANVFTQFLLESVVTMTLALIVAELLLRAVMMPWFSGLGFTAELDISLTQDTTVYAAYIALTLFFGLVAGVAPAFVLSGFRPAAVIRDVSRSPFYSRLTLRKTLIVVQFALSLTFVIILTTISRQIDYASSYEFDFTRKDLLSIELQGNDRARVVSALTGQSGIARHTLLSHLPGTWRDGAHDIRVTAADEWTGIRDYSVDGSFIDVMGLKLIAGRNFDDMAPGVSRSQIIVNELFLERFGLGTPLDAVGKSVLLEGDRQVVIAGVLRDFLFKPLTYSLEPMFLRYEPDDWSVMLAQTTSDDHDEIISRMRLAWHDVDPIRTPQIVWFDYVLTDVYDQFDDIVRVIGFLSIMAFVIAMLGLLGIVTLNAESRVKEVGVRKVLGARTKHIAILLARREAILLGIACLLAIPAGLAAGDELLSTFAHRISLGIGVVLPGILLMVVVAGSIVAAQSIRVSRTNPVTSLRSE